MPTTTHNGTALANKLNPLMGTTREIRETCAMLSRAATSYHRYSEYAANGQSRDWESFAPRLSDGRLDWSWIGAHRTVDQEHIDAKLEQLEHRIHNLVWMLPETDEGPLRARVGGDPRGAPVILTLPTEELTREYADDWGREGICVPYTS